MRQLESIFALVGDRVWGTKLAGRALGATLLRFAAGWIFLWGNLNQYSAGGRTFWAPNWPEAPRGQPFCALLRAEYFYEATWINIRLVDGLFGWCLGRTGFGLGIEAAFSLVPPPIVILVCGSVAVGLCQLLQCGGSPLASAILSALPPCFGVVRSAVSGVGTTFWFHICMPCYPGSGWGRQLWPARYPGLGDCWGLVGVG